MISKSCRHQMHGSFLKWNKFEKVMALMGRTATFLCAICAGSAEPHPKGSGLPSISLSDGGIYEK
jgi:hypothetical protein